MASGERRIAELLRVSKTDVERGNGQRDATMEMKGRRRRMLNSRDDGMLQW